MATENRPRGRPPGEGKNDSPYLAQVADLVVSDSSLKATTAMKRIMRSRNDWGASDETLLRRWQVKWKAIHPVYLAAARDRAESLRRAAEARSWVQTLRQWDETIKALQNSPTLRQWDEVLKGLQNSPTLRQWDEVLKGLQNSPTLRQWNEVLKGLQNSPTLRQWNEVLKGLQNSPAWRGSTAIAARAAFAQRAGGQFKDMPARRLPRNRQRALSILRSSPSPDRQTSS